MKRATSVGQLSPLVVGAGLLLGMAANGLGQTIDFLGSATTNWVGYAGSPVPTLLTTPPGSIADSPSTGSSYGRLNTSFSSYAGSWQVGDTYSFGFDGVVANNTALRLEFSNGAGTVAGLLGLQFVIVNATANNGDSVQVNALGGTSTSLFSGGNLGGPAGTAERILGDITLSILSGTTASVSGSIVDDVGNVWTGPSTTINLGTAPAALYAAFNVNAGGGVTGINALDWTATPVPEPSTTVLFAGLGLVGLALVHRLRRNR